MARILVLLEVGYPVTINGEKLVVQTARHVHGGDLEVKLMGGSKGYTLRFANALLLGAENNPVTYLAATEDWLLPLLDETDAESSQELS